MLKFSRTLLAAALLGALSFGQAEAALILSYSGTTGAASTGGAGQTFSLQASFSNVPVAIPEPRVGIYPPSAISFTLGGTGYAVDSAHLGDYFVELFDPTNPAYPGVYIPALASAGLGALAPVYESSTTPGWDATAPTGTSFYNYLGGLSSTIDLETAGGNVTLSFDSPIDASISPVSSVPEPSSLALLLGGAAAGAARRRRAATPA